MMNEGTENDLEKYIQWAYKKLKSNSYYDNRNLFLKNRIVDFENDNVKDESSEDLINSIEDKFKEIAKVIEKDKEVNFNFIQSNDLEEDDLKFSKILHNDYQVKVNFTIRSVPKSIIYDKKGSTIIRNFEEKNSKAIVDKLMYYLDIDIMSQIIGTLWVMIIGKEIEKEYKDYAEGNILEDNIHDNLKLFRPYYLAYERWRDDAINIVEDRINKGNRSTMISLDIKEYYYSINLDIDRDKEEMLRIFDQSESKKFVSKEVFKSINNYVFKVIEAYSKAMNLNSVFNNQVNEYKYILPIGFLPSSILGNWYLHEFDRLVNKKITPLYYKRYVDDILIVLNTDYNKQKIFSEEEILNNKFYENDLFEIGILVNNKSENIEGKKGTEIIVLNNAKSFLEFTNKVNRMDTILKKSILDNLEKILSGDIKIDGIKNKFVEDDVFLDWSINNPIKNKCTLKELEDNIKEINKNLKFESSRFKKIYLIKEYIENKDAYLSIQDEKVKVYDFESNGSKALIENFKRQILENSSAFKFLPQKDQVLNSFDSEVYKVDYKDSIHKLSSIEDLKINRYNLSKFLARIIYSDKLENDDYTKDVDEKILWIFQGRHAIEYFFLWDKVFNYYLMNKKYDKIKKLYNNIYNSINNLKLDFAEFSFTDINCNYDEEKNSIKEDNLKSDLKVYLKFVLAMNYALDDGIFINNNYTELNTIEKFEEKIKKDLERKLNNENGIDIEILGIYKLKEYIRISNMLNHSLVKSPLINYYYLNYKKCYSNKYNIININFINSILGKQELLTNRNSCFFVNSNYKNCIVRQAFDNKKECESNNCNIEMCKFSVEYNPRFVHLHECIINSINNIIARGEIVCKGKEIIEAENSFYNLNGVKHKNYNINICSDVSTVLNYVIEKDEIHCIKKNKKIDIKVHNNKCIELNHINGNSCRNCNYNIVCLKNKIFNTHYKYFDLNDYLFVQKERIINYLEYGRNQKKNKLKIGIVNMKIHDEDLVSSFKKVPNIGSERLEKISKLLNMAIKNGAEVIVFPEVSVPIEWLGVISDFARRHDVLIICGLEHIIYDNKLCCNYIATILPDKYKDYTYAVVKLRLKNHYSPKEKEWVKGYGWDIPTENNSSSGFWKKEYDLFRWKGIDFSTFSCFELANIQDRALFTSFVDLLIGSVHNRDVNYYSNIMESLARDVHCYFVNVNNSSLGDNRIIKPSSTNTKNILQVSGGINDVVLIGEIDVKKLRDFQIKNHNLQKDDKSFKAVPPEFKYNNVKIRDNLPL